VPTDIDLIYSNFIELAQERDTFTTDDIRALLPDVDPRSIAPVANKARRDNLIVEVGRVKSLVPESKGRRIAVYRAAAKPALPAVGGPDGDAAGELTAPDDDATASEISNLRSFMEARGYLIGAEELTALLLMLATRTWVVLAGPTGTGKSSMVRLLAEAFGGQMYDIQVKPNWTSSEDVLGYYSEVSGKFLPGPLYAALQAAGKQDGTLRFIRFDEMNLASPEYYLAEVLSAGEYWPPGEPGNRHSSLINPPLLPESLEIDAVRLRDGVFLVGTLNMDETAKTLSPKVLDRAAVYDLHHVDLYSLPVSADESTITKAPDLPVLTGLLRKRSHAVGEATAHLEEAVVQAVGDLLTDLDQHARVLGAPIGYRQRDAMLLMVAAWKAAGMSSLLSSQAVLDVALRSTLVPKLQGSSPAAVQALRALCIQLLAAVDLPESAPISHFQSAAVQSPFPRTMDRLLEMLSQAEDLGYFSAW
jgi:5-methylcytosine-specific restriction protein B